MEKYVKPEVEFIDFSTEMVTTSVTDTPGWNDGED